MNSFTILLLINTSIIFLGIGSIIHAIYSYRLNKRVAMLEQILSEKIGKDYEKEKHLP